MFQRACDQARRYTSPYAGLRRKHDGTVFSTVAAFIVVNSDGWSLTARHVFDEIARAQRSVAGALAIDKELEAVRGQKGGNAKRRDRHIRELGRKKADSLSGQVEIWAAGVDWGTTMPRVVEFQPHPVADLAVFKLDPFVPGPEQSYPVLRSEGLAPGLSVCRIGFPWHSVEADFADDNFAVKSGFPAPLFALEGIVSRFRVEKGPDEMSATYIQTSSPGLRGQSGGPLFDVDAHLCGLQSSTTHLDLGFDAAYERDGEKRIERQFLNVGQAVHVDDIAAFLDSLGIAYASE